MSLFGRLLQGAVQGAGARRAGLNAGDEVRRAREQEEAQRARQAQMDMLRMALEQSQMRRNDAVAAKAAAPVEPTIHVMGRTLPDTPEGRAQAVQWRGENRAAPRGRASGAAPVGRGSARSSGGAQPRSVTLRSANGDAGVWAGQYPGVADIRVELRRKYPALTEGEIRGIAQRAFEHHQRNNGSATAKRRTNSGLP